jgi:hypothetical protein
MDEEVVRERLRGSGEYSFTRRIKVRVKRTAISGAVSVMSCALATNISYGVAVNVNFMAIKAAAVSSSLKALVMSSQSLFRGYNLDVLPRILSSTQLVCTAV